MPVTARLSRLFYERLGEEIANELVEWFNAVDATYRADLRQLNELNFARFDAKMEQRLAELAATLRVEFRTELQALSTELKSEIQGLTIKVDGLRGDVKGDVSGLRGDVRGDVIGLRGELKADMQALKAELIKWMFLFWAGSALAGLLFR